MLSEEEILNTTVVHILSDIYDSDKVTFVKSLSSIINTSNSKNVVILPNSVLSGNLRRNGSEVIRLNSDAKNKRALLAEIKTAIKSKVPGGSNTIIHNHEYQFSKEIQYVCKQMNIHSTHTLFTKPKPETFLNTLLGRSKYFSNNFDVCTISEELETYCLQNYRAFISTISVIPVELAISNNPVPHERIIALAKSWGILDQPSIILLTQEFYGNRLWETHVIELGKILETFQEEQSVQLIILDNNKENLLREKFQETLTSMNLLRFVNPVSECSDFEAALSIASLYLDLSPFPPESSSILQKCAENGRLCIAWKHGANIEVFSDRSIENLVEPFNFTIFAQKIREFLLFSKENTKSRDENFKRSVREKYARGAVESALFKFYNKALAKKA